MQDRVSFAGTFEAKLLKTGVVPGNLRQLQEPAADALTYSR